MILLLTLGCKENPTPPQKTEPLPDIPTVEIPQTESDVTEAQWNIDSLEAQFLAHADTGMPYGKPFMDSYFDLLELGDETCPGSSTRLSPDNVDGCVASTGYAYYGLSVYHTIFEELDEDDTLDGEPLDGWIVIGDFEMLTPDNMSFQAGGHVSEIRWLQDTGDMLLEGEIQGSWMWEGGQESWVQHGISGLFYYQSLQTNGGTLEISLDGAIQWNGQSLAFDDVILFSDSPGFLGTVEMRDPSGLWHVIVSDELSECAQHSYDGLVSEQAICLDWSNHIEHFRRLMEPSR
ncbi:MAG: hypothetical protein VXZ96_15510 [Myxococcota bacterium]|nr:hypothetical protein [Myxococcota bacterium]